MKRAASSDIPGDTSAEERQSLQQILPSLGAPVSPPQLKSKIYRQGPKATQAFPAPSSKDHSTAAIEAGEVEVTDHLSIFSTKLHEFTRASLDSRPTSRLPIKQWADLYRRNEHPEGHHFVIHQHDHPIAGPHYDLRLQFSKTSSVSWSIMYGLPGDPNSERLNRNAMETRVHCLWNHLVETASVQTGSVIIWDTGEYEILPYDADISLPETDDSRSEDSCDAHLAEEVLSESDKLQESFRNRKIRLRLHGTRLPKDYTVILRMDKGTDYTRTNRKGPKRRRKPVGPGHIAQRPPSTSDSDIEPTSESAHESAAKTPQTGDAEATHSDNDVDIQIQTNNAYPGSTNTIGSIHQRRWYLSMDRTNSGFTLVKPRNEDGITPSSSKKRVWVRTRSRDGTVGGFEPFFVHGPEVERSIVTGRLGKDVLGDEEVEGFVPRRGWRPVLN
ncbi:hypothetical protein N7466_004796 [Penicillium verhagenii]|uniref:uncharacterized protein n=1 Tax=Penicillium verhagenii TaxID=1562060 RepID=UPI002544E8BA|nr:uncharacterized protein N7466_004796 [Penicillium verhagenii]KAJ5935249.1 hypothetical protein N7466_004796 [Penicillium verhagenii]